MPLDPSEVQGDGPQPVDLWLGGEEGGREGKAQGEQLQVPGQVRPQQGEQNLETGADQGEK